MLTESEKRAASLAITRFGVDRTRILQLFEKLAQSSHLERRTNVLDLLVRQKLITNAQAQELRKALGATQLDARNLPIRNEDKRTVAPSDTVNLVPPGAVFEPRTVGDFRILRLLGEGGMGSVYLGYDERLKSHVAIKVLADLLAGNQDYIDRFYREAKSGAALDHPNIVRTIAVGQDQAVGCHYLVLEYVDGPSAHALLDRFGKLEVGDAVHLIQEIAGALEHAHSRNIVHRDIKPDNILITASGVAKLADLGLSKRTDEASHLTGARQGFGTPYYMPYEQAMQARGADGRSDIYALGATFYHLLTGEVPFAGANHLEILEKKDRGKFAPASTINPLVPPELNRILGRMLARAPEDRYQTASELIVDLDRSRLGSALPSFVDQDRALQDPLVRARLTSPAQLTRLDVDTGKERPAPTTVAVRGTWYLRYRNKEGRLCKSRATTEEVVRRLTDRRFAQAVEVGASPEGPFKPPTEYEEFAPTRMDPPPKQNGSNKATVREQAPKTVQLARPAAPAEQPSRWMGPLALAIGAAIPLLFLVYSWIARN